MGNVLFVWGHAPEAERGIPLPQVGLWGAEGLCEGTRMD